MQKFKSLCNRCRSKLAENKQRLFCGNPDKPFVVWAIMAINILDFDPVLHQKVRFNQQLYAVLLSEEEFVALSPEAEVVIHFMSHDKIFVRASLLGHVNFVAKKEALIPVEAHIIE